MGKKGDTGPSAKTLKKEKEKLVEDKTFGLKNKNKSKQVQKYVAGVTNQVMQGGTKKVRFFQSQSKSNTIFDIKHFYSVRVDKINNYNKNMLKKQRKRRRRSRMPLFRVSLKLWLTFRRQKMERVSFLSAFIIKSHFSRLQENIVQLLQSRSL